MEKIGEILKKRRLEISISLEHAAEETMIASRYLESIENSDFSPFPGSVYAKGFLRRYAEYLKLEEIEIRRLLTQYEAEQKKGEEAQPQIEGKGIDSQTTILRNVRANRKNLYLYSILAILGFLIAGGILGAIIVPFLEREPKIFIDTNKLLSQEELIKKDNKPEEKQETIAKGAIKPEIKGVLLEGNAFEEVWVQVQLDSGKNKSILVKAGEKIKWTAKEKICLTVGNAGVIAWKFNSHAIGALGKTGTAKTILFTPEKMQTVIKKEQPTPIPPSGEENNQDKEKAVVRNPGTVSSQEQASREENTTQTTKEKAKEAGTVSKPVPIKKNEGNNLGNISKQSISVDKIQKGTQSVKM
ncbi:helix-turn-helix domain-containing protein [Candidatus Desantisbacteria bacterium]|nr:helix-turn-helix domain-containing protein [Candidatus Desantisbacteria bacterium]